MKRAAVKPKPKRTGLDYLMDLQASHEQMLKALESAVSAAEYVIGLVEDDVRAGHDPSPFVKSCPSAALAHAYAAMAFVGDARKALRAGREASATARKEESDGR